MNIDNRDIDDIVKHLLQFVLRGFYSIQFVLLIDAILFHSVLCEEDLAHLLGIKRPEVRALCTKLIEDRMLSSYSQPEYQQGSRSVRRYYYFIKFPEAVDAIKWKVHRIVSALKEDLEKNSHPQGYVCPVCLTKYSQIEAVALLNYDRTQFLCSLCEEPLIEDDSGKKTKEKQIKLTRLMAQVEPIINYLKKIDDVRIEENSFDLSLTKLIPPQNNSVAAYTVNPKHRRRQEMAIALAGGTPIQPVPGSAAAMLAASQGSNVISTSVNGVLSNASSRRAGIKSQATLHVNITTASDEQAQRELQERKAEEKRIQNALPTWHEQSTIGETLGLFGAEDEDDVDRLKRLNGNAATYGNYDGYNNGGNNNDASYSREEIEQREAEKALAEYYANLAKKRQQEDEDEDDDINDEDMDEEVDSDEVEDADGFEDVENNNNEGDETKKLKNKESTDDNTDGTKDQNLTKENSLKKEEQESEEDEEMDGEFEDV
ncbi:related to Transcription initiation factor IIE subunit alpha [Saccharomycodes ludwigii]|uniref:Related to Transcription initiation factor IIE subunit alpha n=1 Tax=Saccharomycodes ludwigii TaxID=36035 RepID=A0A376BBK8_9ASCO|nr:hypothetical protein SCDLUD_003127 [Saccharomycodes ludwigii]KAH3900157.1 hypothetical protein SCDLUD_003127 [Saccharomycodes ludwigii]SSD62006.1 related to Transcription initiation factor IIE subunit alpha [Saccharomycodes ludwigii]